MSFLLIHWILYPIYAIMRFAHYFRAYFISHPTLTVWLSLHLFVHPIMIPMFLQIETFSTQGSHLCKTAIKTMVV